VGNVDERKGDQERRFSPSVPLDASHPNAVLEVTAEKYDALVADLEAPSEPSEAPAAHDVAASPPEGASDGIRVAPPQAAPHSGFSSGRAELDESLAKYALQASGTSKAPAPRMLSSMLVELRSGFCDPDGELLGVLDRPSWRRLSRGRRSEIVGELERVCEERGLWEVEAWRRARGEKPRHIIGYWHAPNLPAGART
jgi:hypothetical protein